MLSALATSTFNFLQSNENEVKASGLQTNVKLSLFTDSMLPQIENTKESTNRLLDLKNDFNTIEDTRINKQKSIVFPIHLQ